MAYTPTKEQQAVIDARTADILVAAAAGSGKTAVLVDRIMKKITNPSDPVDIDEILIVTFTNDAAAQMRERIHKAIDERLSKEPDNERLIRQSRRVGFAPIMTIDSFCQSALKRYFHVLNIDPAFRVLDGAEGEILWGRAEEEIYEEFLSKGDEAFLSMLDRYCPGSDSESIYEILSEIRKFSDSAPYPEEWINSAAERLASIETADDLMDSPYAKWEHAYLSKYFGSCLSREEELLRRCDLPDGPDYYHDGIAKDCSYLKSLTETADFRTMLKILETWASDKYNIGSKPKSVVATETSEGIKNSRTAIRKNIAGYLSYSEASFAQLAADIKACAPSVAKLCEFAVACRKRFRELMDEAGGYTFAEIAHMTLELFLKKDEDGSLHCTDAARQCRKCYKEIMIDEYQDSNLVQELFLWAVSTAEDGVPDTFRVGDIKQSIYLFRMARPDLFTEKFDSYSDAEDAPARRILLNKNFRSRKTVLDGINSIFRRIMKKELGGVEYDTTAELVYGADYTHPFTKAEAVNELLLGKRDEAADNEERDRMSIAAVVRRIRQLTDPKTGLQIRDGNGVRTAGYGDIAVLSKTGTKLMYPLIKGLLAAGIPAYAADMKGYFEAPEVRYVLDFLKILDNPLQDVAFAAVLKSPMGGFTQENLAELRVFSMECTKSNKSVYLYHVLTRLREAEFVKESFLPLRAKAEAFLALYESLSEKKLYLNVPELLTELYRETNYVSYVTVAPGGDVAARNLKVLVEKAKEFTNGIFTELSDFVRYIDDLIRYDVQPDSAGEGTDRAVRFMTIHGSKGLEYPIVFLIDAERQLSGGRPEGSLVFNSDLGIGSKCFFPKERIVKSSYPYDVIRKRKEIDERGEVLRLLYVALTRAKEKLIVVGNLTAKEFKKYLESVPKANEPLGMDRVIGAKSFLDLMLPCMLSDMDEDARKKALPIDEYTWTDFSLESDEWAILPYGAEELSELTRQTPAAIEQKQEDTDVTEELRQFFEYRYPYVSDNRPVKVSVSALKMSAMEEEAETAQIPEIRISHPEEERPVPGFLTPKEEGNIMGAMRGTYYHRILELHDYGRDGSESDSLSEAEELAKRKFVPSDLPKEVSHKKLSAFYQSDIGLRMKAAAQQGKLKREQAFVMSVPADTVDPSYDKKETVLVQGIIDAMFLEEGGYVLLDYKTDRVPEGDDGSFLINRYKAQLRYYADAIRRGTGENVKDIYIYSFALQKSIRL